MFFATVKRTPIAKDSRFSIAIFTGHQTKIPSFMYHTYSVSAAFSAAVTDSLHPAQTPGDERADDDPGASQFDADVSHSKVPPIPMQQVYDLYQ